LLEYDWDIQFDAFLSTLQIQRFIRAFDKEVPLEKSYGGIE
jgi:hypothetical protein